MPDRRRERQGPPTPMKLNSAITAALSALLVAGCARGRRARRGAHADVDVELVTGWRNGWMTDPILRFWSVSRKRRWPNLCSISVENREGGRPFRKDPASSSAVSQTSRWCRGRIRTGILGILPHIPSATEVKAGIKRCGSVIDYAREKKVSSNTVRGWLSRSLRRQRGASGGIGIHKALKMPRGNPCRFESDLAHQISNRETL